MCEFHDMRHTGFHRLTVVNGTLVKLGRHNLFRKFSLKFSSLDTPIISPIFFRNIGDISWIMIEISPKMCNFV